MRRSWGAPGAAPAATSRGRGGDDSATTSSRPLPWVLDVESREIYRSGFGIAKDSVLGSRGSANVCADEVLVPSEWRQTVVVVHSLGTVGGLGPNGVDVPFHGPLCVKPEGAAVMKAVVERVMAEKNSQGRLTKNDGPRQMTLGRGAGDHHILVDKVDHDVEDSPPSSPCPWLRVRGARIDNFLTDFVIRALFSCVFGRPVFYRPGGPPSGHAEDCGR